MYTAVSLREACAVEKGLIATYGTFAPSGYNLTIGGEGTQGHRKILSSEHRQKISEAHKGKIFTSQHRENIRTAKLGRSLTDEHREKLSRATRGRPKSPERREQMRLVHLNRPPTGKSGVKGVSPLPPNGWVANLTIGVKKRLYLGYFKSIEAAAAAIEDAKEKYLVARPTTVSAVPLG
jgi:hypothetical protein